MSLDVKLVEPETGRVLYDANITHNLNEMAMQAGIYQQVWRPDELGIETARKVYESSYAGVWDMLMRPEHYRQFDSENGWGLYENFMPWLIDYMRACRAFPLAKIETSR